MSGVSRWRDSGHLERAVETAGGQEAFDSAVRWDRKGMFQSGWRNYDIVYTDGLFTLRKELVGADLPASCLQGHDV